MKKIILLIMLMVGVINAQDWLNASFWQRIPSSTIVIPSSGFNFGLSSTNYFRVSGGQLQFTNDGVNFKAIPDSLASLGGWTDNGSNITPTTITDTVKIKYMQFVSGGNWGSPTFTNIGATTLALTGLATFDIGASFKNLSAIPSGITTDYTRFYTLDNGSNVTLRAVVDDNTTETDRMILTDKDWSGIPAAYQFDGEDDYVSVADNNNLDFAGTPFTVSFWLKYNSSAADQVIMDKATGGLRIFITSANLLAISKANTSIWATYDISAYLNTLAHYVIGWNGTNKFLYINGKPIINSAQSTNLIEATASPLYIGKTEASNNYYLKGILGELRLFNRALTASEVLAHYNNGRPDLYQLDYADRGASQTKVATYDSSAVNDSTITLTYGKKYRWVKGNADSLKVGTTKYTATTEFTWTTGAVYAYGDLTNSNMLPIGNVAEYLPQNAGRLGWIESSGNQLSGATSGTPICLNAENRPMQYRDIKKSIANTATALTNVIPKGYIIREIRLKGSASLTGVKIGTSSGGEQIVASTTAGTTASLATLVSTANAGYSETADQTIYVEHATAGQILDIIIKCEKIGN